MEQITKEELLDVIGKFELGNHTEVVSVEPYGSGHINDTFRLEVKEDGKKKLYILNGKKVPERVFEMKTIKNWRCYWSICRPEMFH